MIFLLLFPRLRRGLHSDAAPLARLSPRYAVAFRGMRCGSTAGQRKVQDPLDTLWAGARCTGFASRMPALPQDERHLRAERVCSPSWAGASGATWVMGGPSSGCSVKYCSA